jgi:hypothetical protein
MASVGQAPDTFQTCRAQTLTEELMKSLSGPEFDSGIAAFVACQIV